jgi:chemotaxis signal transduction protein
MSDLHVRVRVAGESYAVPVGDVVEVAELGDVAPVPGAAPALIGVRNLRGRVLPVIDLATVFALPRSAAPERIVIAERGDRMAGLAVDAVDGVEPLGDASEDVDSPHLAGAALADGALVGVVDVESVLAAVEGAPVA